MRLDKYLKVSRLVKRRTVANELCDAKHVEVNGTDVSPFIRTVEVGAMASKVSVHGPVRDKVNAIIPAFVDDTPFYDEIAKVEEMLRN